MSEFNYCVTAHRPTAVTDSLVVCFTGVGQLNLIGMNKKQSKT